MLKPYGIVFVFLFSLLQARSQGEGADSTSPQRRIMAIYQAATGEASHLYNGREYQPHPHTFEDTHPYFLTRGWTVGAVRYDGARYENVPLLYDVVRDELVLRHFNLYSAINLQKERIDTFFLAGHTFIRMLTDSGRSATPLFYALLYRGGVTLLARHSKKISVTYQGANTVVRVFGKTHYYFKKGGTYYAVSGKRSLLDLLGDKKKAVQQYANRNRLSFRKNEAAAMIQLAAYYDQLTN